MNTFDELASHLKASPVGSFDLLIQVSVAPFQGNRPVGPSGIFINGFKMAQLEADSGVNPTHLAFLDEFVHPVFPRELGEVLDFWLDLAMQDACLCYSTDQSAHCGYHVMLGYSLQDGVVSAISFSDDRVAPVRFVDFASTGTFLDDLNILLNTFAVGSHVGGVLSEPRLSRDYICFPDDSPVDNLSSVISPN